eukprot:SAG22_NODE_337_length_12043_cov_58.339556_10_plen_124_part_00
MNDSTMPCKQRSFVSAVESQGKADKRSEKAVKKRGPLPHRRRGRKRGLNRLGRDKLAVREFLAVLDPPDHREPRPAAEQHKAAAGKVGPVGPERRLQWIEAFGRPGCQVLREPSDADCNKCPM